MYEIKWVLTSRLPCIHTHTHTHTHTGLAAFDALSVHAYVIGAPEQHDVQGKEDPHGRRLRVWGGWGKVRDTLRAAGRPALPIISGEWGWSTCSDGAGHPTMCVGGASPDASTPADQAMFLSRQWLLNTRQNLSTSIYYDWIDDGTNASLGEHNFGVRLPSGGADQPGAPKPAYAAAAALQRYFGTRNFLGNLAATTVGTTATADTADTATAAQFAYVMAFGAELPSGSTSDPPPLPSALAQGLGSSPTDALVVWSLAVPSECAAARLVGVQHNTACPGTIWEGDAAALANTSCDAVCREMLGCRSYTVWPLGEAAAGGFGGGGGGGGGGEAFCQLHHSRCAAPQYSPSCGDGHGCGTDAATYARAYTVSQTACALSLDVQLPPSGPRCFHELDFLGQPSNRTHHADGGGVLRAVPVSEEPVFLLGVPCDSTHSTAATEGGVGGGVGTQGVVAYQCVEGASCVPAATGVSYESCRQKCRAVDLPGPTPRIHASGNPIARPIALNAASSSRLNTTDFPAANVGGPRRPPPVGRVPPLGWSSWKTCGDAACTHDYCDEEEVKSTALAMLSNGMANLDWNYLLLDDCWASPERNSTSGALTWDKGRFPSGIPDLVSWLHARGLRFGLYTSAGNQTCSR